MGKSIREFLVTELNVNAERLLKWLLISMITIEVLLVIGDIVFNMMNTIKLSPVRGFFNTANESGLASWIAITQTWMIGLTCSLICWVTCANNAERWQRWGWSFVALFFLYMAMDDGAKFHERVGSSVRTLIHDANPGTDPTMIGFFPSYGWLLVFVPIFGAFGLFLLWFLNRELKSAVEKIKVVAAIGLLVIAVLVDFVEGLEPTHALNLHASISGAFAWDFDIVRHYSKSLEEFLEMLAMTLLWVVFLRHLMTTTAEIRLRFTNRPGSA